MFFEKRACNHRSVFLIQRKQKEGSPVKVAIVGSRELELSQLFWLEPLVPNCEAVVSGGAKGVDQLAWEIAHQRGVTCIELLPDYGRYGRAAPLIRDREIVKEADLVLAVWDGTSRGTRYVMEQCTKTNTPLRVYRPDGTPYLPFEWQQDPFSQSEI